MPTYFPAAGHAARAPRHVTCTPARQKISRFRCRVTTLRPAFLRFRRAVRDFDTRARARACAAASMSPQCGAQRRWHASPRRAFFSRVDDSTWRRAGRQGCLFFSSPFIIEQQVSQRSPPASCSAQIHGAGLLVIASRPSGHRHVMLIQDTGAAGSARCALQARPEHRRHRVSSLVGAVPASRRRAHYRSRVFVLPSRLPPSFSPAQRHSLFREFTFLSEPGSGISRTSCPSSAAGEIRVRFSI